MAKDADRINGLLKRLADNTISPEEARELFFLLKQDKNDTDLSPTVYELWKEYSDREELPETDWERIYRNVIRQPSKKEAGIKRMSFMKYAAAAIVFILFGTGLYYFRINKNESNYSVVGKDQPGIPVPADSSDPSAPSASNAVLTLANGQTIILDEAGNGSLAFQGSTEIIKLDGGKIAYQSKGPASVTEYNVLTVPRGSKITTITLSDGTKVWINAGSSLKFPVSFPEEERKVEANGEIYFEVARESQRKFIVAAKANTIEVLGTHFNVNAYDDEEIQRITLLEGSVRVSGKSYDQILVPGEQANVNMEGSTFLKKEVDIKETMAWINGEFHFGDKADIGSVMRQIARWYDLEVEYKGNSDVHIGGSISRNVNVSQVLQMLEKAGGVKFKLEGKKLAVMY